MTQYMQHEQVFRRLKCLWATQMSKWVEIRVVKKTQFFFVLPNPPGFFYEKKQSTGENG